MVLSGHHPATQLLRVFTECVACERVHADRAIPAEQIVSHRGRPTPDARFFDWKLVGFYGSSKMEYGQDKLLDARVEAMARQGHVPTMSVLVAECANSGRTIHIQMSPFNPNTPAAGHIRGMFSSDVNPVDLDMPGTIRAGWSVTDIWNGLNRQHNGYYFAVREFDRNGDPVNFARFRNIWGLKYELISDFREFKRNFLAEVPRSCRRFDWNMFLEDLGPEESRLC